MFIHGTGVLKRRDECLYLRKAQEVTVERLAKAVMCSPHQTDLGHEMRNGRITMNADAMLCQTIFLEFSVACTEAYFFPCSYTPVPKPSTASRNGRPPTRRTRTRRWSRGRRRQRSLQLCVFGHESLEPDSDALNDRQQNGTSYRRVSGCFHATSYGEGAAGQEACYYCFTSC